MIRSRRNRVLGLVIVVGIFSYSMYSLAGKSAFPGDSRLVWLKQQIPIVLVIIGLGLILPAYVWARGRFLNLISNKETKRSRLPRNRMSKPGDVHARMGSPSEVVSRVAVPIAAPTAWLKGAPSATPPALMTRGLVVSHVFFILTLIPAALYFRDWLLGVALVLLALWLLWRTLLIHSTIISQEGMAQLTTRGVVFVAWESIETVARGLGSDSVYIYTPHGRMFISESWFRNPREGWDWVRDKLAHARSLTR